jgi:hypothetical protein
VSNTFEVRDDPGVGQHPGWSGAEANGGMLNPEALAKMQLSPSTNADASV